MHSSLLLHLSLIPSIGPATIHALIKRLPSELLGQIYQLNATDIMHYSGLSYKIAHTIATGLADQKILENELLLIDKYHINWVTRYDADYPTFLQHITAPPAILYYQGVLPADCKGLAVVGSREADYYGRSIIDQLVPCLVQAGYSIISGGAKGADTMAHQAALNAQGKTIAILGSGLLKPYPLQNKKLFEAITASGGAVVSSFALNATAMPGNFPARNRIIAGMSMGCLVVQAAAQSGARITAQYALEQGRTVFAVPGLITNPLSMGCHELIKQGAHLVSGIETIFEGLGYESIGSSSLPIKETFSNQDASETNLIVSLCTTARTLEELLEATGLSMVQLMADLFELQLQGKVIQDGAGLWQRNS